MVKVTYTNQYGEFKELEFPTYEDAQEFLVQSVFDGIDMTNIEIKVEGE